MMTERIGMKRSIHRSIRYSIVHAFNDHLNNQDRKLEKYLRVIPIQRNVSSRTIIFRQTKSEIQSEDSQVRVSLFPRNRQSVVISITFADGAIYIA